MALTLTGQWETTKFSELFPMVTDGTFLYYYDTNYDAVRKFDIAGAAVVASFSATAVRPILHDGVNLYVFDGIFIYKLDTATMTIISSYTGFPAGIASYVSMASDANFIYICFSAPAPLGGIYKIDKVTMTLSSTWSPPDPNNYSVRNDCLTHLGGFLFAGGRFAAAGGHHRMVKIDAATMVTDSFYQDSRPVVGDNGGIMSVVNDGAFIYCGDWGGTVPYAAPIIDKVNPATFLYADSWVGAVGSQSIYWLVCNGGFVYCQFRASSGDNEVIRKIDTPTMNWVADCSDPDYRMTPQVFAGATFVGVAYDDAAQRLITVNPATMLYTIFFTGNPLAGGAWALASDAGFLYVAGYEMPAIVTKIDPATMAVVNWWGEHWDYEYEYCFGITTLSGFVYPIISQGWDGAAYVPRVVKVDPATMTQVDRWDDIVHGHGSYIIDDGVSLYAAITGNVVARVIKIDPTTMLEITRWTGAAGENINWAYWSAMAHNGTNLFVGLNKNPGQVVKIDPATMATVSRWTDGIAEGYVYAVVTDASYVYALVYNFLLDEALVVKIDPATMLEVARWSAHAHNGAYFLAYNNGTLYVSVQANAGEPMWYAVNCVTMATTDSWIDVVSGGDGLAVQCGSMFIGASDHGWVLKFSPPLPIVATLAATRVS